MDKYQSNIIQGFKGDFSAKILKYTSEFDIDFHEVESLKLKIKSRDKDSTLYQEDDLSFLRDLRLIEDNNDGVRLTVAGLLFVGKKESIVKHLPQAEIILLTYNNDGQTEYNKRLELKVPLISAVDRIQQIFEDRNSIQNIQMGLFKLEVY